MIPDSKIKETQIKHNLIDEKTIGKLIDVDNAYRITKKLAFPRLVGSKGEIKANIIVVDEFKNAGYESISRDTFRTSLHIWIFISYIFLILGSGLILLALSFYLSPFSIL